MSETSLNERNSTSSRSTYGRGELELMGIVQAQLTVSNTSLCPFGGIGVLGRSWREGRDLARLRFAECGAGFTARAPKVLGTLSVTRCPITHSAFVSVARLFGPGRCASTHLTP